MSKRTRLIEMYIGKGSDSGHWFTNYVEIPRDTPEKDIEKVAIKAAHEQFSSFAFVGVYSYHDVEEDED